MPNLKNIKGQRFERLRVVKYAGLNKNGCALWECICNCGKIKIILGSVLRNSMTKSCGCLRDEKVRQRAIENNFTHGMSNIPEFRIWVAMRKRCRNKNNADYYLYGGRGIKVCERWQDFKNFIEDIGRRPSKKHSIDRVDNDGNYEPGNCRWVLPEIQARNTRKTVFIEFNGKKQSLSEWAREVGVSRETLKYRFKKMPIEKAMTMPKRW